MALMAHRALNDTSQDLEIKYPDGRVVIVEIKGDRKSAVSVRDLTSQATIHVSAMSAASIGAASVFGWYVRSGAPWAEPDAAILHADWQTVGDDLWRAVGRIAHDENDVHPEQRHLFDPSEFGKERL
jgi:hypothetical protein